MCQGAGIGNHGGMPDDELLERVRELRSRGRSPKEIARALKVRPATVTPLIQRLAAAEAQKEAPLVGCWVNQGWSSSVRFTGHPEWPDTGAGETGLLGWSSSLLRVSGAVRCGCASSWSTPGAWG
jgi:hypothetical protein